MIRNPRPLTPGTVRTLRVAYWILIGALLSVIFVTFADCKPVSLQYMPDVAAQAALDRAEDACWRSLGQKGPPPLIRLVTGKRLNCVKSDPAKPGFLYDGTCHDGATTDMSESLVAWHGEAWALTALGDELTHQALWRSTGNRHDDHAGDDYGGLLVRCWAAMRAVN